MLCRRNQSRRRVARSVSSVRRAAFTLLELLLVLAILVVITGIVMVNLGGAQTEAYIGSATAQMRGLKGNIDHFKLRIGTVPESLDELRDGPSDASKKAKWTDPIAKEIPVDPWTNPYQYTKNGNGFEIRCAGPDGQMSTDDDIVVEG